MAIAVIVLFHDDGKVEIGSTDKMACLHMTDLDHFTHKKPDVPMILYNVEHEIREAMGKLAK